VTPVLDKYRSNFSFWSIFLNVRKTGAAIAYGESLGADANAMETGIGK